MISGAFLEKGRNIFPLNSTPSLWTVDASVLAQYIVAHRRLTLQCYAQLESLKLSMDFVDTKEPDTKKSLTAQVISVMRDIT